MDESLRAFASTWSADSIVGTIMATLCVVAVAGFCSRELLLLERYHDEKKVDGGASGIDDVARPRRTMSKGDLPSKCCEAAGSCVRSGVRAQARMLPTARPVSGDESIVPAAQCVRACVKCVSAQTGCRSCTTFLSQMISHMLTLTV